MALITTRRKVPERYDQNLKITSSIDVCLLRKQRPAKSKIFNPNPKKKFFQTKTRPEPEKIFFSTRNLRNSYFKILALKIFKTAYNIRIYIGYKDNFCQVFGINHISSRQVSVFFRKKVSF